MTTIACVIIASEKRRTQVWERVVPSAASQAFDELVVVGDWVELVPPRDVRYLCVAPLTRTTTDALVKRDAGTLATDSDVIVYLCDDHALHPDFLQALQTVLNEPWDVLVPARCCKHPESGIIMLNSGGEHGYCGGHSGVFRRHVVQALPWSAGPHDRCWDTNMSARQQALGFRFVSFHDLPILVEDVEPENRPWQ
jgi:hypothetical protein